MSEHYPTIKVRNTGRGVVRVYEIVNVETGDGEYFDLVLQPGEDSLIDAEWGEAVKWAKRVRAD